MPRHQWEDLTVMHARIVRKLARNRRIRERLTTASLAFVVMFMLALAIHVFVSAKVGAMGSHKRCRSCGLYDDAHEVDCLAVQRAAREKLQVECDHQSGTYTRTTGDPLGPPCCGRCGLELSELRSPARESDQAVDDFLMHELELLSNNESLRESTARGHLDYEQGRFVSYASVRALIEELEAVPPRKE